MIVPSTSPLTRFRQNPILYHIVGWALYIFYELFFVIVITRVSGQNSVFDYIIPYVINIGLFYFHSEFVLNFSFNSRRKSFITFFLLLLLELGIYMALMNAVNILSGDKKNNLPLFHGNWIAFFRQMWRGNYFIIMSTAYWLIKRSFNYQKKIMEMERMQVINMAHKSRLEKNLVEVENAYLQAQINPHLLFNTLNFIYNNVQQASVKASEAVLLLSELMNYSLREQEADGKTSLAKEVDQVRNLVRINQIRFDNTLFLEMSIDGDFHEARIIPLGLLVFIENVFKHGDLTDKTNPGKISITYTGAILELATENKKKNRNKMYSHGTGLNNITKRLNNAYKDAYTLTIDNKETQYFLNLTVNLASNHDNVLHN